MVSSLPAPATLYSYWPTSGLPDSYGWSMEPDWREKIYSLASPAWGAYPMDWPTPPYRRPYWWQLRKRKRLANVERVLGVFDDEALSRFWNHLRGGQSPHEDADDYLLRCYAAMIGEAVVVRRLDTTEQIKT